MAYIDLGVTRQAERFSAVLDRTVVAVSWGVAIAFDHKGKAAAKWHRLRARQSGKQVGLTGADLERAVLGIAAAQPGLVKITTAAEAAGA